MYSTWLYLCIFAMLILYWIQECHAQLYWFILDFYFCLSNHHLSVNSVNNSYTIIVFGWHCLMTLFINCLLTVFVGYPRQQKAKSVDKAKYGRAVSYLYPTLNFTPFWSRLSSKLFNFLQTLGNILSWRCPMQ